MNVCWKQSYLPRRLTRPCLLHVVIWTNEKLARESWNCFQQARTQRAQLTPTANPNKHDAHKRSCGEGTQRPTPWALRSRPAPRHAGHSGSPRSSSRFAQKGFTANGNPQGEQGREEAIDKKQGAVDQVRYQSGDGSCVKQVGSFRGQVPTMSQSHAPHGGTEVRWFQHRRLPNQAL